MNELQMERVKLLLSTMGIQCQTHKLDRTMVYKIGGHP